MYLSRFLWVATFLLLTAGCGIGPNVSDSNITGANVDAGEDEGNNIQDFRPTFAVENASITAPTLPNFSIVDISLHQKATEMMLSSDSSFSGASWEPVATEAAFSFAANSTSCGTRSIYLKLRRANGKESSAWGESVSIDCGQRLISQTGTVSARYQETSVWTGTEMIVFGGTLSDGSGTQTGAIYNPTTDSWRSMTDATETRVTHKAVWTGSKMLVWGGKDQSFGGGTYSSGVLIYDLATDSWSKVTPAGEPTGRIQHQAVWTGTEMIVWGGLRGSDLADGARYNPSTVSWSAMSTVGAPDARRSFLAVWDGTEMIVWSGQSGVQHASDLNAKAYNPATDTWRDYDLPFEMNIYNSSNNYEGAIAAFSDGNILTWGHAWGVHDRFANVFDTLASTLTTDLSIELPGPSGDTYFSSGVWTGSHFILRGTTLIYGGSTFTDGIIFSPTPFAP